MASIITGLGDLDQALKALEHQLSGSELLPAAMAGAEPMLDAARSMAPNKSGELHSAMHIVGSATSTQAIASVQVADSGDGGQHQYARHDEFGTARAPAHPFMRPAAAVSRHAVLAAITSHLANHIKP